VSENFDAVFEPRDRGEWIARGGTHEFNFVAQCELKVEVGRTDDFGSLKNSANKIFSKIVHGCHKPWKTWKVKGKNIGSESQAKPGNLFGPEKLSHFSFLKS